MEEEIFLFMDVIIVPKDMIQTHLLLDVLQDVLLLVMLTEKNLELVIPLL